MALRALADIPGVVDLQRRAPSPRRRGRRGGRRCRTGTHVVPWPPCRTGRGVEQVGRHHRLLRRASHGHPPLDRDHIRVLLIGGHSYWRPGRGGRRFVPCSVSTTRRAPSWASSAVPLLGIGTAGATGHARSTVTVAAVGDVAVGTLSPALWMLEYSDSSYDSCRTAPREAGRPFSPLEGLMTRLGCWASVRRARSGAGVARSAGSRRRRPRRMHVLR